MMLRFFPLAMMLLLLSACGSTPQQTAKKYDTNVEPYPEIGLYFTSPSKALLQQCTDFAAESVLHYCLRNNFQLEHFYQSLSGSGLFQNVRFADAGADYEVLISTTELKSESAEDLSKVMLSSATLLLLPVTLENPVVVQVTVTWREVPIAFYQYQPSHQQTLSLFNNPNAGNYAFSEKLIEDFLVDVQKDDVFSPQYLANRLGSSDYEKDFQGPSNIADFVAAQSIIFNDPFLGRMNTYLHSQHHSDKIDLIVYPVRKAHWNTDQEAITEELERAKKEITYVAKEKGYSQPDFDEVQSLETEIAGKSVQGLFTTASIIGDLEEQLYSSTFMFILEDKFVKFRATFPANFISEDILTALGQLKVPEESDFMAALRKKHL